MSLISIQNLLEPFRRKVHLITICMIALLFLVFRLHGGGMSLQKQSSPEPRPSSSLFERSSGSFERSSEPVRPQSPNLDEMVSPRKTVSTPTPKQPSRESQSERSGLDDIERSLGLR